MKPRILAGLIGSGIQASRTPALHEQEGDAQGLRYSITFVAPGKPEVFTH